MIEPKARPKNRQYNLYHANFYCCCDRRRYRCHTSILVNSRPEWAANNRGTSHSNRECSRHLVVGCFFGYIESRTTIPKYLITFVAAGVLGGFTTFSSYMYEVVLNKELDDVLWSGLILLATLGLGLLAMVIGLAAGRNI